ncbi:uncharacterized protein MELLADRAFT_113104 [Melampsora larici-populina 98AG31]|uniref:Uncharacterized protein n=1 Tax=Melampsora larici-populina (strain 98AG31 / pathotype 3-4-7) TaxID=747676 RepID=F4S8R5_MELLP|nr:uncharacterized protein MELLADRAFT_113104 [Melampsora larici-populina 98AG31]EGF98941.1 hypothetical protein MELLADRAFT_113104 [Melampsora larici-populina 98AG31]
MGGPRRGATLHFGQGGIGGADRARACLGRPLPGQQARVGPALDPTMCRPRSGLKVPPWCTNLHHIQAFLENSWSNQPPRKLVVPRYMDLQKKTGNTFKSGVVEVNEEYIWKDIASSSLELWSAF